MTQLQALAPHVWNHKWLSRSQEDIWFPCQNARVKEQVRISSSCWVTEGGPRRRQTVWDSLGLIYITQTGITVNCSDQSWLIKSLSLEKNPENKQPSMQSQVEISFFLSSQALHPAQPKSMFVLEAVVCWKVFGQNPRGQ